MTLIQLLQAAGMVAGAIILHHALAALDRMSPQTRHGVRVAFVLLALGGFAQLVVPWISDQAAAGADLLLAAGLALLMIFDRRCAACPRVFTAPAPRRRKDARQIGGEPA